MDGKLISTTTNDLHTVGADTGTDVQLEVDDLLEITSIGGLNTTVSKTGTTVKVEVDGSGISYTDEQAQDAVGTILTDTNTIDFTYTDGTPSITADLKYEDGNGINLSDSASGLKANIYFTNEAKGDLILRGTTLWDRLAKGNDKEVLRMNNTTVEWGVPSIPISFTYLVHITSGITGMYGGSATLTGDGAVTFPAVYPDFPRSFNASFQSLNLSTNWVGTVYVTGLDQNGEALTETHTNFTIPRGATATWTGTLAFSAVTEIGWTQTGSPSGYNIKIVSAGVGDVYGIPYRSTGASPTMIMNIRNGAVATSTINWGTGCLSGGAGLSSGDDLFISVDVG